MSLDTSLAALQRAVDFEKAGLDYYTKARDKAQHPTTKAIFQFLVEEEDKHMDYLSTLYEVLKAKNIWPEELTISLDKDFKLIFVEESKKIDTNVKVSTDEIEALDFAIEMENKGRAMYLELAEKSSTPPEQKLFAELAAWEFGHASYCESFRDYYQDHGMYTEE